MTLVSTHFAMYHTDCGVVYSEPDICNCYRCTSRQEGRDEQLGKGLQLRPLLDLFPWPWQFNHCLIADGMLQGNYINYKYGSPWT